MQSLAASTGSKYIVNSPLYPGDLFNNHGCYWPVPDYRADYWQMAHAAAEKFAYGRSNAKAMHTKQAMFYASASSGRDLMAEIIMYPDRCIDHARRMSTDNDLPYLTMRRAADVLDPQRMAHIFKMNYQRNMVASVVASQHMRDTFVVGPPHREQMLRSVSERHSVLRGIHFEDAIFEKHLWLPYCLFDATTGIYDGDHAWSFNAPIEKALANSIQYGSTVPLYARHGHSFDVKDIWGREVSIVDQAWEDARALIDITGTTVRLADGSDVNFRAETCAALLLVRLMHDHQYRSGEGFLDRDRAHPIVKQHYDNLKDTERMDRLKTRILPYMAEFCNWPTLHRILDNDPALKAFWNDHVSPTRKNLRSTHEIETEILSYLPRGGYDNASLRQKVQERRDPPRAFSMAQVDLRSSSHGQHIFPFDTGYDPKRFNDRNFARLGGVADPMRDDPNCGFYAPEQSAALMTLAEFLPDGLPPVKAPRTLLYLDDAVSGVRSAEFTHKHHIDQLSEQSALIDPLANGGNGFAIASAAETREDFSDRIRSLGMEFTRQGEPQNPNEAWRAAHGVGNIIPASDVRKSLDMYSGYREGTETMFHRALAANVPLTLESDVEQTVIRRMIDLDLDGIIIAPGEMSGSSYRYLVEGALAATGLTKRPREGGRFQFEFFMDWSSYLPPPLRQPPEKLDLADLIIHLGLKTKHALDKRNPPKDRDLYVSMARLLDFYEMLIDPVNGNATTERHERTGKDTQHSIIDTKQIDPAFIGFTLYQPGAPNLALTDILRRGEHSDYDAFLQDPDYQSFLNNKLDVAAWRQDPVQKAKLAYMTWFYMRAHELGDVRTKLPVVGHLLTKGIRAFDSDDLIDLPDQYRDARNWWHNLAAKEKTNILGLSRTMRVQGPALAKT